MRLVIFFNDKSFSVDGTHVVDLYLSSDPSQSINMRLVAEGILQEVTAEDAGPRDEEEPGTETCLIKHDPTDKNHHLFLEILFIHCLFLVLFVCLSGNFLGHLSH